MNKRHNIQKQILVKQTRNASEQKQQINKKNKNILKISSYTFQ